MAAGAAWWIAAACVLAACGDTLAGLNATWPGCFKPKTEETVDPGKTNIHVTGLYLIDCNFTTVYYDSLKNYPNTKIIAVENIKVVNATAFTYDYFTNLETLLMKNNSILGKNLPSNLFRNCRRLRNINYVSNDMSDAPADLLKGLHQLERLILFNCKLREIPAFFTSQIFPHMDLFSARGNEISEMDPTAFANAVHLTVLSLSSNRIANLHTDLIKPLTKLTAIFLIDNRVRVIPEAFFQHKPSLKHIDISHNLIENIPLNAFLGTTDLKLLSLEDNRLTHLPPNFILNLQTTGIRLDEFNFHGNPWECACLNNLLVRVKKLKILYDSLQFDGQHQACQIREIIFQNNNNCL